MQWMVRTILVVLVIAGLGGGGWVFANRKDLAAFLPMPAGAYAKFMCSCLFVADMPEEQARNWSQLSVPVKLVRIDYQKKTVVARALLQTRTARYVNARCGCTLE